MNTPAWWSLKSFSFATTTETKDFYYNSSEYLPSFLKDVLKKEEIKGKQFYIYQFVHKPSEEFGEVYTIIILQCSSVLLEDSKNFHKEFCETLCRQKTTIRLFLRQYKDYKNFNFHVTNVRHDLLMSLQHVMNNIDDFLRKIRKQTSASRPFFDKEEIKRSIKDHKNYISELEAPDTAKEIKYPQSINVFETIKKQISLYRTTAVGKGFSIDTSMLENQAVFVFCDTLQFNRAIGPGPSPAGFFSLEI